MLSALALIFSLAIASSPDIVRTKDGGFMRGTISELVPNSHVIIVLPTGEARRVAMKDVDYAGPDVGQAPPGDTPRLSQSSPNARLHLSSPQKDARFYLPTGKTVARLRQGISSSDVEAYTFRELCEAPCVVELPPGKYDLAIGMDTDDPVRSNAMVDIQGEMNVEGVYTSLLPVRLAGWAVMIGGGILGTYFIIKSEPGAEVNNTKLFTGIGVAVGSVLVGGFLSRIEDDVDIYVLE